MKYLALMVFSVFFISCKQEKKETTKEEVKNEEKVAVVTSNYPEELQEVFKAHGGLDTWKNMGTLTFDIPKPDAKETHTVNLKTREDKIETATYTIGHNGAKTWLLDTDGTYKGDAVFYHNLMFYFYAMPFVLADDGIVYEETEPVVFEGKGYPGIKISYNPGVGASYKDLYFIHFDPKTKKMAWLGYSVSYRSGEVSNKYSWIHYNDWQTVNGLVLPKSITWHNVEEGLIKDARNTVTFENVTVTKEAKSASFFAKPEAAVFVEGKVQE
ncbi:MAG: DUF6503 family protein [Cellulophaga sp.]